MVAGALNFDLCPSLRELNRECGSGDTSLSPEIIDDALVNALNKLREAAGEIEKILKLTQKRSACDYNMLRGVDWGGACKILYNKRRTRDEVFSVSKIFSDPAWDILLDLMISEYSGRRVSVSDACIASCVPNTTALRWLTVMEDRNLVYRQTDAMDGRRVFVRLTRDAITMMQSFLMKSGIV